MADKIKKYICKFITTFFRESYYGLILMICCETTTIIVLSRLWNCRFITRSVYRSLKYGLASLTFWLVILALCDMSKAWLVEGYCRSNGGEGARWLGIYCKSIERMFHSRSRSRNLGGSVPLASKKKQLSEWVRMFCQFTENIFIRGSGKFKVPVYYDAPTQKGKWDSFLRMFDKKVRQW